jgi:predicted O-linked N-acetylglucosamine transferase (SPINDLY family)
VYFFTFGVLTRLANTVDLAFVSRGTKTDWATRSFRSIAHDWIDVPSHTSEQLAVTLANRDLDVMIDLGGWMDPVGLQALSLKPVRKQFKWVGGQSATTGLRSFDGYFTDRYQTPRGTDHLYSEPLIRLKSGYVTYTPPPYLPKPTLAPRRGTVALGVIANPAKISQAFLTDLRERLPGWNAQVQRSGRVLELRFIEQRYRQAQIRARIEAVLAPAGWSAPKPEFILPTTHLEYLTAVSELDAIIDTWPYSGGLTTIEGLAMGVPTYTRAGMLFCERHTASHCAYAGMSLRSVALEHFNGMPKHLRSGRSLITADSPRVNHDALAEELLAYLRA